MMKIGSSTILTGTYLASKARNGAMIIVGSSIRANSEAIISFFSSPESSISSSAS
jgi:hypothetical protein